MTKKQKNVLFRIITGAVLLILGYLLPVRELYKTIFFLGAYLIVGYDVLYGAARNMFGGNVFGEAFLMSVATIGAIIIGEYFEAVLVMWLYQLGELFQSYAVGKSRKSITALMDLRPDYANVMEDGQLVQTDPELIAPGMEIIVKAGEKVPLDGIVIEGNSFTDTSALTGESVPVEVTTGSEVLSGAVNMNGMLTVRVTKAYGESTAAKILDMVENVGGRKTKTEDFITKFARYYAPVVVIAALLLALIPPIFAGWDTLLTWVQRALSFLVVSCPCALVISVPLSYFGGIGGASKEGILIKGSNYLEALAKMKIAVFDKTGTLTKGTFRVTEMIPQNMEKAQLLEYATLAEWYSDHPISFSLKEAYGKEIDTARIEKTEEVAGMGVVVLADGKRIAAGNGTLMERENISYIEAEKPGTVVYVAVDGIFAGSILISDEIREDTKAAIAALKENGVERLIMLTGDTPAVAAYVAKEVGITEAYGGLLPMDKVEKVEALLESKENQKDMLAFVGDGINDAPVLTRADIGIAMGMGGRDAAIEAADVVLMRDEPRKIVKAMKISKKTSRIVKQNIVLALAVKAVALVLSALGIANMLIAVFADVGVMFLAVLNAIRSLRVKHL
jgi:Cd2+/Zn2+-exporting ATPase